MYIYIYMYIHIRTYTNTLVLYLALRSDRPRCIRECMCPLQSRRVRAGMFRKQDDGNLSLKKGHCMCRVHDMSKAISDNSLITGPCASVCGNERGIASCARAHQEASDRYVRASFFSTAVFSAKPCLCCSGAARVRSWGLRQDGERLRLVMC